MRQRIIKLDDDATLGRNQSGSLIVLDSAGGVEVTLPTASRGIHYDFAVKTAVTASDKYEIVTQTDDKIRGTLVGSITNEASNSFVADDADKIDMNGSTTGGLLGTFFTLICDNDGVWNVTGFNNSSGSQATPFA